MIKEDNEIKTSEKSAARLVIENSIALQKVSAEMAFSLNKLMKEVSELVNVFKEAEKSMRDEKTSDTVFKEEISSIKTKLDMLIDQNKTIARGILLLESALKPEKHYSEEYKW